MKTELTEIERKNLATYLLPYVNGDYRELYQPKRASMFHKGKPRLGGAKLQSSKTDISNISITELLELSDAELLELQTKVQTAKKAKEAKTRQSRFF